MDVGWSYVQKVRIRRQAFKKWCWSQSACCAGTSRGFHHQQWAVAALTAPAFVLVLRVRRSVKLPSVSWDSFPVEDALGNYSTHRKKTLTGSENVGRKTTFTYNGVDTDCTDNRDWLIWVSIGWRQLVSRQLLPYSPRVAEGADTDEPRKRPK